MTILCIIGPSGSGKTTIANELSNFGIPQIASYTTRPMRPDEVEGIGHHFIDDRQAELLLSFHRPLAYTVFGGYRYFALYRQVRQQQIDSSLITYVIDEQGYLDLSANLAELTDRMRYEYGFRDFQPIQLLPVSIERPDRGSVDASRTMRDSDRIALPADTFKVRIVNDSPDVASLRVWAKDFGDALRAMLTITSADAMPSSLSPVYTSQPGVAKIIASINDALHNL